MASISSRISKNSLASHDTWAHVFFPICVLMIWAKEHLGGNSLKSERATNANIMLSILWVYLLESQSESKGDVNKMRGFYWTTLVDHKYEFVVYNLHGSFRFNVVLPLLGYHIFPAFKELYFVYRKPAQLSLNSSSTAMNILHSIR